jgi:hypothetical protein
MSSAIKKLTLTTATLLLVVMTATSANNAEQVVFSIPFSQIDMALTGNNRANSTPFGFWIWCAAEAAEKSRGEYQLANACQGNMYFYSLDHNAKPIVGFVLENPDESYTMHVFEGTFAELKANNFTLPHPDFSCTLTNLLPKLKGPYNTVHVECGTAATAFPPAGIPAIPFSAALGGGTGIGNVSNATVVVTGP